MKNVEKKSHNGSNDIYGCLVGLLVSSYFAACPYDIVRAYSGVLFRLNMCAQPAPIIDCVAFPAEENACACTGIAKG